MVIEETVKIPHGFSIDSKWIKEVSIREITGRDEIFISEISSYPIQFKTTSILKLLINLGSQTDNNIKIDDLTLGDRNTLVLHLRRLTYGNILKCVFKCTYCKENLSVNLDIKMLLQSSYPNSQRSYDVKFENIELKLRPINFSDVSSISKPTGKKNKVDYIRSILNKCIIGSNIPLPKEIPKTLISQISSKLEELDPMANIILKNKCPSCNKSFDVYFSPEEFFFREINHSLRQFDFEVHLLALNYHWDLDQIYSLPSRKRKTYVDLIIKTKGEGI